jgi:membrane-bound ClpP family serine protease
MGAWTQLLNQFEAVPPEQRSAWLLAEFRNALNEVSRLRGDRNVLFYASSFLQKPQAPAQLTQITPEELNAFMACMYGMQWDRQLTLILHTPGGVTNAAETIVEYLHSKFSDVEVIVPAFAMSAGTMISLSASRIVMGRQSQLGPIDPQMPIGGKYVSARAIVDQFDKAKQEITGNRLMAHAWAPILSTLGPALLVEAGNALEYGERMVSRWLARRMFNGQANATAMADAVAKHFNDAGTHKSHGRRIGRDEVREQGVVVEELEASQDLQEAVLTAYHLVTILFEQTSAAKMLYSNHGQLWLKNLPPPPGKA